MVLATNVRFADVVVAFAPGAMDAMLALALTLHIDPIFVGAHHLSRFVFVSITTPGIVHLFGAAAGGRGRLGGPVMAHSVGWVERTETHHLRAPAPALMGFAVALPILRNPP